MAAQDQLTFLELSKRTSNGGMIEIAEVLNIAAPMLQDIPWHECNQILSEKVLKRSTLPEGTWRQAYQGVTASASTTQIVIEPTALLEARSQTDEDIVDNAPNPTRLRRDEDMGFVEGLGQQLADHFINGTNVGSPEQFMGLKYRLNDLDQTTVIDEGGSTALTSVYAVDWGMKKAYGIYPSAAANRGRLGLSVINKGKEKVVDVSGTDDTSAYYAYVTQFKWWVGLAVRDDLAIGRYCNIESAGTTYAFDEDKLIELLNEGHFNRATTRLYFNQKIATQAQIKMKDKNNMVWGTAQGLSGSPLLVFDGCICRKMDDSIVKNDETAVTS